MKKKTIFTILLTSIVLGGAFTIVNSKYIANAEQTSNVQLSDIETHWAKGTINKAVQLGYTAGYPDGTFKPNSNVTRAEFIKMTVEALKLPVETNTGGAWYEIYVNSAKKAELVVTSDFKSGDLNSPMTRKEMSRLAARAIAEKTTDDTKWMYLATKNGLITGLGAGELGETKNTTRAQSVTIIDRILTVNAGGTLPVDKYAVASAEVVWHGTNIFTVMPEVFTSNDPTKKDQDAELWKKDLMKITSKDGDWSGEVYSVIAIDLADPSDPNLKLIPPISKLKWQNNSSTSLAEGIPVSKWKDSYLIYYNNEIIYNKAPKHYASYLKHVPLSFTGTTNDRMAFRNGTLNRVAFVFKDTPLDQPIFLLPKKGWSQNSRLKIKISAPAVSSYFVAENYLLEIDGPYYKKY
ncbi:S-layer homology domain-containing protein [Paenibacillus crassostreae]|uniref:SLH domain-containing protein n=1 Tax=Paenibacillus crassostreae TaxID=1763538 RepID=A0A167DSU6_9BACL|nr:S-layer homology domain-containing protein [Paenibacillus crassostreae]AOZ91101.1 hypothetical protein LPB68_02030 [Paenibacillus crassostreae]OAB74739.1 hypothetical protein PNBC_11925 [Paenibacillus crassostreae]